MVGGWAVVLSALVYLCFPLRDRPLGRSLGVAAHARALAGDDLCAQPRHLLHVLDLLRLGRPRRRAGLDFLAIYIGPILVFVFGLPLLQRIVRLAKAENITSIADFLAARYGKS